MIAQPYNPDCAAEGERERERERESERLGKGGENESWMSRISKNKIYVYFDCTGNQYSVLHELWGNAVIKRFQV